MFHAEHVKVGQAAQGVDVVFGHVEGPVGIHLNHELLVIGPYRRDRCHHPPRFDLHAQPTDPPGHGGVDLAPEVVDVTVERDADDGTDGHCLEPGSDLQGLGQREVSRSQFGVGDCHFERGGQLPIYRRIPEELGHLGPERKRTASGPAGAEEAGHAPGPGGLLHVGHRRIDGGGLGQSRALAPPLTFVGHDPDEEHGARPMHTNRRADVPHERDLDPDKFYAVQLHVLAARIPSP